MSRLHRMVNFPLFHTLKKIYEKRKKNRIYPFSMQQSDRFLVRLKSVRGPKVLGVICGNLLVVAWGSYLSGMARRRVLLAQFDPALDPRKHLHLVQKSSGGRGGKVVYSQYYHS